MRELTVAMEAHAEGGGVRGPGHPLAVRMPDQRGNEAPPFSVAPSFPVAAKTLIGD
ncbi:MAG TPA: hypothetical protein VG894_07945 [Bauldia sp.]|nr:hypothetical protein [Bauldia sp.]